MDTLKNALTEAKPTLVEVFSPRCSHCVDMEPVVAELRTRLADKANVILKSTAPSTRISYTNTK